MSAPEVDPIENIRRMKAGESYYAFTPDLIADRKRCKLALTQYNRTEDVSRRDGLEMLRDILLDETPMPRRHLTMSEEDDDAQLEEFPWVEPPVRMDYGYNVKYVPTTILIGPNCSFYSGIHPLDPNIRNGTRGPESGKPITIGEDCWIAGNCIILQGVTIGKGSTVGAGSVVTKDVPPYHCVVGNPARILRKIEVSDAGGDGGDGATVLAGEDTPAS